MRLSRFVGAITALTLLVFVSFNLSSCGSDDSPATASTSYNYGGPGSAWHVNLTGSSTGTFDITVFDNVGGTQVMSIQGDYTRLSTGFVRLTVTTATGTGAPTAGDTADALEVPGMVFLLKPIGAEGEIIPMVNFGSCPTTDMAANWIMTKSSAGDASTTDSYGTFSYTAATGAAVLPAKHRLSDYASVGTNDAIGTGTCDTDTGIMQVTGADMWMTDSGGAIVAVNSAQDIVIAMPQNTLSLADLEGTYAGYVFDENGSTNEKNFPVKVTVAAGGATGTGVAYTDITTGTVDTGGSVTFAFSAANTEGPGFFHATFNDGSGASNMICMATTNAGGSGKDTIMCAGLSGGTKLWSVLLVQQ